MKKITITLSLFLFAFFYIHFFTANVPLFFEAHLFHERLLQEDLLHWIQKTVFIGSSNPVESYGDLVGVYLNLLFTIFKQDFYWWRVIKSIFFALMISVFYNISEYFLKDKKLAILSATTLTLSYPLFLHTFIFDEPFMFAEPFKLLAIYFFITNFYSTNGTRAKLILTAFFSFIAIKIYHPAYSLLGITILTLLTQIKKIKKYALLMIFIALLNIPRNLATTKLGSSAYGPKLWTLRFFTNNFLQTITTPMISFTDLYYKSFSQMLTFFGIWMLIISVLLILANKKLTQKLPAMFQNTALKQNYLFLAIWILCELPIWFVLPETATRYASSLMPPTILILFMLAQRATATIKDKHQNKMRTVIITIAILIMLTNLAYTTAFRTGWGSSFVGQGNVVDYLENITAGRPAIAFYQTMQVAPDFIALNKTNPKKYSTKTNVEYVPIRNLEEQLKNSLKTKKQVFVIKRITSISKQQYPQTNLDAIKTLQKIKTIQGFGRSMFDEIWQEFAPDIAPNTFEIYQLNMSKHIYK